MNISSNLNLNDTTFGNKPRLLKNRIVKLKNGYTVKTDIIKRGKKIMGRVNPQGIVVAAYLNVATGTTRTCRVKGMVFYGTPIKDFFQGIIRRIKNPKLTLRHMNIKFQAKRRKMESMGVAIT